MIIWGDKTEAWFDIWSLEHFIAGISISTIAMFLARNVFADFKIDKKYERRFYGIFILLIAFFWEMLEHYGEAGYTNIEAVTYWFQGVEFWGNRLITDPLLVLLGGLVGLKHSVFVWPARAFSVTWLYVHIFVFPHCMYLHEVFGWD